MTVEERILKLELQCERLATEFYRLSDKVDTNSGLLGRIETNTESLDKILKYVVTPLITILGGLVGVQVVLG